MDTKHICREQIKKNYLIHLYQIAIDTEKREKDLHKVCRKYGVHANLPSVLLMKTLSNPSLTFFRASWNSSSLDIVIRSSSSSIRKFQYVVKTSTI